MHWVVIGVVVILLILVIASAPMLSSGMSRDEEDHERGEHLKNQNGRNGQ